MKKTDITTFFRKYLQRNNYRITSERFEVLEAALAHNGHFDADQLFLEMKSKGNKISRATVYNTLDKLTACGIVTRYRFGERLAKYELTYGNAPHHHIICRSCGKIEEFIDGRVDRMAHDAAASLKYELEDAILHIYGICPECIEKKKVNEI